MWYSSKSRNEKADRPSKVEKIVSFPDDIGEHTNGMHARNINQNKKRMLLNYRVLTYCLLFVLLVVTAGVTARQLLVKSGSDKNEAFRMKKLLDANKINDNGNNTLLVIAQDTRKNKFSSILYQFSAPSRRRMEKLLVIKKHPWLHEFLPQTFLIKISRKINVEYLAKNNL